VTGNTIINSQGQGDNPVCSTRDEISQPPPAISPRAATGNLYIIFVIIGNFDEMRTRSG